LTKDAAVVLGRIVVSIGATDDPSNKRFCAPAGEPPTAFKFDASPTDKRGVISLRQVGRQS
jgi:hypothetical protein